MIWYLTALLLFSILIWPVTAVIALVVNLCRVPKMAKEMYPGIDAFYENLDDIDMDENGDDESKIVENCIDNSVSNNNDIKDYEIEYLWFSNNESDWLNALSKYYSFLKPHQMDIETYMEELDAETVRNYTVAEFFDFLHDYYFVWKYTAANRLATTRKSLRKYIFESRMDELETIHKALFNSNKDDIRSCMMIATKIRGLGTAGASGLLSILYPQKFATLDQFVVKSLNKIPCLPNSGNINRINPENIKIKEAVLLIELLREKAAELNEKFNTDFWTPRKLDMILWSIGR